MYKRFTAILFFVAVLFNSKAQGSLDHLDKLGLLAELSYIKSKAEFSVSKEMERADARVPKPWVAAYVNLKSAVDQFISQLSADMAQRNSARPFKKINNLLKEKNLADVKATDDAFAPAYAAALEKIQKLYSALLASLPQKITAGVDTYTGIIELGETIVGGMAERRTAKVEKINALLDKVRLNPVTDLNKKEGPTGEKK